MEERYAYWDREANIVWIPTAPAEFVDSEELSWGLVDRDKKTGEVAGSRSGTPARLFRSR
jgi:hypothetical protein